MKTIIFALALMSFGANAQVYVYPNVINFGNQAQVQIHNTTNDSISCSGSVNMTTQLGRTEMVYYFDLISAHSFSMRSFYISNFQDRIQFVNHSIFCHKAK